MMFPEKSRDKVKSHFMSKIIESPVNYKGAKVAALRIETPASASIKPSAPEKLDSALINAGVFVCVSFKEPGFCYKLMIQGEKTALDANLNTAIAIFKSVKFLRK